MTPTDDTAPDTLPQWLCGRFGDEPWIDLDEADRSFWEHEAAAVRRAVARGGFKPRQKTS